MKSKIISILAAFVFLTSGLIAQTGSIRGNIYDKDTGEPIIYGNVILEGTDFGANTDLDGFFSFGNIPAGNYNLVATYLGYDSVAVQISLLEKAIVYKSIYMNSEGIDLSTVNVSARREQNRSDVKVSAISVNPSQIKSLPSAGGEPDIAQYLSVLPGVIFTGDQGGQLYIRGGSPIQNKILLDGMTIYNPFHSIGFFSVFETEIIRNVDVLTGGFNAEYGGRVSAVVDIKTREGNKKRFGGIVSTNPFQSKLLVEGPISKLKETGGGSTSFILTGKHSYIDQTSKVLYDYAAPDSLGLPYGFTDLYGKLSFVSGNGSKLNLFGFNFLDNVNYGGVADLNWNSSGGGANFTLIPSASNITIDGIVAFSNYNITLDEGDDRPRESSIDGFNAGLNFTSFGANNEVKYGFEINGFSTNFEFVNFLDATIGQESFTTELGAYVKYKQKIGGLILEPSIRMQYYASLSDFSIEPRLGVKYNATDRLRFKFGGGLYSQNLISSVNERDVVNLFVGFLSGPEEDVFKPGTTELTDHNLQKAIHGVAGVEIDLNDNLELNVEPYYKKYTQLLNVNRNKRSANDPDYASETGDAYGIDFLVRYQNKDLFVWTTYSLGYVNRDDGEQVYPTIFDRRHNMNFLTTYAFGAEKDWEASVRFNFGTGFPFTLTQGFHSDYNLQDGITSDFLTGSGELGILFSEDRNSGRLPSYHRLDLSLKKTITFSKYTKLEATASITNVYNRNNIFFFDRVSYERVDQLPILPSIGLVFSF